MHSSLFSAGARTKPTFSSALFILIALLCFVITGAAQNKTSPPSPSGQGSQPAPPEAGGPQGDIGPIAVPKKKTEEERPAPKPPKFKNPEGMTDFSIRKDVSLVNVDVGVVTKEGQFIPGLKQGNFRVFEDGVPQKVFSFSQTEAPITAVLLLEFASTSNYFINDMLNGAYTFASSLKPNDWVAVVSYDMRSQILVDFTQDKRSILGALHTLRIPGFSETNMFDALYDTLDRVDGIEGRKYVVLISSGRDTFSRITFDKILSKVKATQNVTIFTVGTGQNIRLRADASMGPLQRMDYLQADNQMATFAKMTGGRSFFPRFEGEFPEIFRDIATIIRNQYSISYQPTNPKQDGSYRKIKIELVDETGNTLKIANEKGKQLKYTVMARDGYRAKQVVE